MTSPIVVALGPASEQLDWTVGDDWTSKEWAVLLDGGPTVLTDGTWTVHGQVRSRTSGLVLAQWSTAVLDPAADGRVLLGSAAVPLADGSFLGTSTVRLAHSVDVSRRWGALAGELELEVTRVQNGVRTVNRTIVKATARATEDVST